MYIILYIYSHYIGRNEVVKVKPLTKEAFSRWGYFISKDDTTDINRLSSANYIGNLAVFEMGEQVSVSILNPFKRKLIIAFMELHQETHELCVAIQNDCIITVAENMKNKPDSTSIEAFYLKEGDSVIYKNGVWHWVPFAVTDDGCKQLIVYKNQTGANDFTKHEFQEPVEILL
jgi:ureidoglycolate lyase